MASSTIHDPLTINLERQTRALLSHIAPDSEYARYISQASSPAHLLSTLSQLLANPALTLIVAATFRPLLTDLCARWLQDEELPEDRFIALCLLIEPHEEVFPVLSAFCRGPSFTEGPLACVASSLSIDTLDKTRLHRLLLAYYRILQANRLLPRDLLWPISSLSKLFWKPHPDTGVQLLAIRCYALQSGMGEAERERLETRILGDFCGVDCSIHYGQNTDGSDVEIDGWLFPTLETRRIVNARAALMHDQQDFYSPEDSGVSPLLRESDFCPLVANIHGILLLKSSTSPAASSNVIPTPSAVNSLRTLAMQLSLRVPTLISSPPSSGKSLLLSHLASVLYPGERDRIVTIHLADTSLDPRSLLGSYVSSPTQLGTFEWKDGVLVRAMKEGKWLVFEDIDRGSSEVLGLIKPLAESLDLGNWIGVRGAIEVPNRGRVEAAESFALFATRSVVPLATGKIPTAAFFGAHKFHEVTINSPLPEEVKSILDARFPKLAGAVVQALIGLWQSIQSLGSTSSTRSIGLRELEKFCRRVENVLPSHHQPMEVSQDNDAFIALSSLFPNPTLREDLYLEARDVFFGAGTLTTAAHAHAERVSALVADSLALDPDRRRWVLQGRTPEFDTEKDVNGDVVAVRVGRTRLAARVSKSMVFPSVTRPFAMHKPAVCLLSRIATSISLGEPVLLTGETGTGKTSVVTHLASLLRRPLISLNLSHQTESSDLLGGFKPIDARIPGSELHERFLQLFGGTFSRRKNAKFEESARKAVAEGKWKRAVVLWKESVRLAKERIQAKQVEDAQEPEHAATDADAPRKRRKLEQSSLQVSEAAWSEFQQDVDEFDIQHAQGKGKFAFDFVEGPLVKALRAGDWILLDEINLASPETLECITGLLHGPTASITLTEQGSIEAVPRHPDFRLFACMNPATDVGKKDLPPNIRARFTEIDVPPPDADRETLLSIITQYIGSCAIGDKAAIMNVAEFYAAVKDLAEKRQLADGSNHRPHYSMRTLARALTFAADIAPMYSLRRALWEGCLMAFTMVLDPPSAEIVSSLAQKHLLSGVRNPRSLLSRDPTLSASRISEEFIKLGPFFLERGPLPEDPVEHYIMTPSVETKLIDLARIVLTRRFPVLIEGPTSSGKTSAVEYLAKRTGHRFIRINNHEHTDVQEYLGSYVSDPVTGKLVFKDGLLVHALRNGHWIVLDELNLAPTDVLEALNRLLDDNRELVVPETQEVIRPHPHFMLFATQNPPGVYAGRKVLSRAFRNRFLEVHFQDVPQAELETILCQRCRIAPSYGQRIVSVFRELQKRRQAGRIFESKQGFATLRDLFRWAGRDAVGYQELAENGYMLLAERARREDDKLVVKEVIESVMKVHIDPQRMYDIHSEALHFTAFLGCPIPAASQLVWTSAMQRLFVLVARALRFNEPVLLVGETGSGKTSVCQVFADAVSRHLHTVNCHQNTETADLIGGLRPIRNRAAVEADILRDANTVIQGAGVADIPMDAQAMLDFIGKLLKGGVDASLDPHLQDLQQRLRRSSALFDWYDGPLVRAMREGDVFLLDEISLADDSVLERLNSVLEPERTIVLAERGGTDVDQPAIRAVDGFQLLATMNPGGDYGKKELSPALRNRFTEVWVPPVDNRADLKLIVDASWRHETLKPCTNTLLNFVDWLRDRVGDRSICSLRDILAWISFSNAVSLESKMSTNEIFHHAANMTFLDGLGSLPQLVTYTPEALCRIKAEAICKLQELAPFSEDDLPSYAYDPCQYVQLGSFAVPKGPREQVVHNFNLQAPTTRGNAMRVVRACQVPKPILLEGSPGVGKTSLITALANIAGYHLCRINLSDQTDLVDLFGSDLPVENGGAGEFAWKDAEFLKALQEGHWVLLDEMNLAPQAILEGLNAVLDHRGTVYVPELGRSFVRHPAFRVFAAQNPLHQGGGRKGLPKSFLDRFTKCYVDELSAEDLLLICRNLFQDCDEDILRAMITFNTRLNHEIVIRRAFGRDGSPWEFNLRDVIRWGELLRLSSPFGRPVDHLRIIYLNRFRSLADRDSAMLLFDSIFATSSVLSTSVPHPLVSSSFLRLGHFQSARGNFTLPSRPRGILQTHLTAMEAIGACIARSWLVIVTGRHDSGKTHLIRAMANLTGNHLYDISVSSATDITDILGSFEQIDLRTRVFSVAQKILSLAEHRMRDAIGSAGSYSNYRSLYSTLFASKPSSLSTVLQIASRALHELRCLCGSEDDDNQLQLETLQDEVEGMLAERSVTGRFEWVDGPLVRAIREGYWVVLDGANLCSPSVLDRLNSLCEPDGALTLSERGYVDGQIQILKPHPNFRLFMAIDPRHGELSRAMRNRGIEVALLSSLTAEDERRLQDHLRLPDLPGSHLRSLSTSFESVRRGLCPTATLSVVPHSQRPSPSFVDQDSPSSTLLTHAHLVGLTQPSRALLHFLVRVLPPRDIPIWLRFLASLEPTGGRTYSAIQAALIDLQSPGFFQVIFGLRTSASGCIEDYSKSLPLDAFMVCSPCAECTTEIGCHPAHQITLQALNLFSEISFLKSGKSEVPSGSREVDYGLHKALTTITGRTQQRCIDALRAVLVEAYDTAEGVLQALAGGEMKLESLNLSIKLLSYCRHLRRAAVENYFDHSSVQVLSTWISDVLHGCDQVFNKVAAASDVLRESISLTTGLGMTDIWRNLLPQKYLIPYHELQDLEKSARQPSRSSDSYENRRRILEIMALSTVPTASTDNDHTRLSALAEKSRQFFQLGCSSVPSRQHQSDPCSLIVELSVLSGLHSNISVSTGTTMQLLLDATCRDPRGDLLRFCPYQHAVWSSDVDKGVSASVLARLQSHWLGALWNDLELYFADDGPAFLLRPVHLWTTYKKSQWKGVSLSSLKEYDSSLHRHLSFTFMQCSIVVPRLEQLCTFLSQNIVMLSDCFDNSFDNRLMDSIRDCRLDNNSAALNTLVSLLDRTTCMPFQNALRRFMIPAVEPFASQISSRGQQVVALGRCWIALSRLLLELFVPDVPVDPAAALRCSVDFWREEEALLNQQLELHLNLEKHTAGNTSNNVTRYLDSLLENIRAHAQRPSSHIPHRPDVARLQMFWSEIYQFLGQVISPSKVDSLLALIESGGPSASTREEVLQASISGFCQRLDTIYPDFEDIARTIQFALLQFRFGVRLVRSVSLIKPDSEGASARLATALAAFPSIRSARLLKESVDIDSNRNLSPFDRVLLKVTAAALQCSLHGVLGYIDEIGSAYEQAFRLWGIDRAREGEKEQELNSLYRRNGLDHDATTEAEAEEKEFLELFPTFEDALERTNPTEVQVNGRGSAFTELSQVRQLVNLHLDIFNNSTSNSQSNAITAFHNIREATLGSMLETHLTSLPDSLDTEALHPQFALLESRLSALKGTSAFNGSRSNFYTDPNVLEAKKALPVLVALRARITTIIEEWPDQMVLYNLQSRCDTILAFDFSSPVAKFLSALEQLLVQTDDWEMYANRDNTLKDHRHALTTLVIDWRRLELSCWKELLQSQYESFASHVCDFWFQLYDLTIRGPLTAVEEECRSESGALAKYLNQLPPLLDDFLRSSNLGQFESRMGLLRSFEYFVDSLAQAKSRDQRMALQRVQLILHATWRYYQHFTPQVAASLAEQRHLLEKEVQGFIKLASWKDVNVHALKESARRTHHSLYKLIRKFRDVMRQPVVDRMSPVFAGDAECTPADARTLYIPVVELPMRLPPTNLDAMPAVPSHLLNLPLTFKRFNNLLDSRISSSLKRHPAHTIEELALEVIATSRNLANQPSASNLTKEQREKLKKALLVRKRKALSDLLKELKRAGMATNVKPEVLQHLRDEQWVREQPLMPTAAGAIPVEKGEYYLDRVRGALPRLRELLASHHSDITTRDLLRGVNFVESGFYLALSGRYQLAHALGSFTALQHLTRRLHILSDASKLVLLEVSAPSVLNDLREVANNTLHALEELSRGIATFYDLQEQCDAGATLQEKVHLICGTTRSLCDRLSVVLRDAKPLPTTLLHEEYAVAAEVVEHIRTLPDRLLDVAATEPKLHYMLRPTELWIREQSVPKPPLSTSAKYSNAETESVIDSLLVNVQSLLKYCPEEVGPSMSSPLDDPEDNYIRDGSHIISQLTKSLGMDKLLKDLVPTVTNQLQEVLQKNLERLLPFLERYIKFAEEELAAQGAWTKALFKLDFILCSVMHTIAKQGFCIPPDTDESASAEGGEEAAGGVGLGDGSGAENVSKEIEDESQVEGLRGDTEDLDQERGPDDKDKDNTIEMSEDFGGALEDVPEDEDDEQDDEKRDEEEGEEPEEQLGELDGGDPNKVDEKLWGDESAENDKGEQDQIPQDRSEGNEQESDVVAKENGRRKEKESDKGKQGERDADSSIPPADDDKEDEPQDEPQEEGAGEEDNELPNAGGAPMEDHVPDANTLDLPDDMTLDQDDKETDRGNEGEMDVDDEMDGGDDGQPEDDAMEADENAANPAESTEDTHLEGDQLADQLPHATEGNDQPADEEDDRGAVARPDTSSENGNADTQQQTNESAAHDQHGGTGDQKEDAVSAENTNQDATAEEAKQDGSGLRTEEPQNSPKDTAQNPGSAEGFQRGSAYSRAHKDLATNPLRNLGDALKEVQARFEDIFSGESEPAPEFTPNPNEVEQVEYADGGEDGGMQALGPAGEEQVTKLSELKLAEDEPTAEGEVAMDVDVELPTEQHTPPPPTSAFRADPTDEVPHPDVEGAITQNETRTGLRSDHESLLPDASALKADDVPMESEVEEASIEAALRAWQAQGQPPSSADEIWRLYSSLTHDLSSQLCEQLRLILAPTLATRLRGDYRTGKRLNMKKIISYIASDYTKDKIWLRRTRPSQREYQVLIALDDSRSMAESHSVHLAYETLALVAKALGRLEVGDIAIAKFGSGVDLLHSFDEGPFTDAAGARVLGAFGFDQRATNVLSLVETSLGVLERARERAMSASAGELWQLEIIISDGICQDHERLRTVLRKAADQRVMIVFIIIDSLHPAAPAPTTTANTGATANQNSILSMNQVAYKMVEGRMELQMERYLDSFPFEYYVVLRSVETLPEVLSGTLRQFFERVSEE
ncbi:midasin [Leucogyrophana mollusca]|uniref:Midasin n=1 Tax=Leucogyrophana mollusca TaxID=85980 RepID=A0ACB8BRK9_9AGAM|nr:midasin [Leucogyrophana mollusca]